MLKCVDPLVTYLHFPLLTLHCPMSPLLFAGVFIATVAVALFAFEAGLRLGRRRGRQPDPEPQQPILTLVASILSLCAFILGFTFGLASSHFDARSQAVFDEAVAISTAYRRAELLPDPERSNVGASSRLRRPSREPETIRRQSRWSRAATTVADRDLGRVGNREPT